MTDPTPDRSVTGNGLSSRWPWNAAVVLLGLVALLIISKMALDNLVTTGPTPPGGKVGASDAIALITASGAILTGIIGAYFGVNIASKSANAAQATQVQANENQKTSVAVAAALDPNSETAKQLVQNLTK